MCDCARRERDSLVLSDRCRIHIAIWGRANREVVNDHSTAAVLDARYRSLVPAREAGQNRCTRIIPSRARLCYWLVLSSEPGERDLFKRFGFHFWPSFGKVIRHKFDHLITWT